MTDAFAGQLDDALATLVDLMDNLVADEWRASNAFSPEVASCHDDLLAARSHDERKSRIEKWLEQHQPCFFGRHAAKKDRIDFCFLTDEDFKKGDRHVAGTIAVARLAWRRRARRGLSHAFVILAVSESLALAEPNTALLEVARRIAELYLCRDVPANLIAHDELFLEAGECRSWKVGVNFFAAQADGRWWKDHRIPGGIALSMNSVGHMACVRRLDREFGEEDQSEGLYWGLKTAMQLLNETKAGVSGRNTRLHEIADRSEPHAITCPAIAGKTLVGKNRCEYFGLYHTDQTFPAAYFRPDVLRPDEPVFDDLDLSYLHYDSPDNPDYALMGVGLPQ